MQISNTLLATILSFLIVSSKTTFAAPVAAKEVHAPVTITSNPDTESGTTDDYLVVLADDDKRPWDEVFAEMGYNRSSFSMNSIDGDSKIETFGTNMRAFTIRMEESGYASVSAMPNIKYMEKNTIEPWPSISSDLAPLAPEGPVERSVWNKLDFRKRDQEQHPETFIQQGTAPWGLQQISSGTPVDLSGRDPADLSYKYRFDKAGGLGVDVYVLDSGVDIKFVEFGGRAKNLFSAFGNNTIFTDEVGHGTFAAGVVSSLHYGVAKNANIWGVKIGDSKGPSLIGWWNGLDAVLTAHNQRKTQPGFKGSVATMSLGLKNGTYSEALADLFGQASKAGIHMTLAALNHNEDSCQRFPQMLTKTLPLFAVGATNINETRARFSNYGPCVNIYAPGESIVSISAKSPTGVMMQHGTSFACPMVAGQIADELVRNPDLMLDPPGMRKLILSKAQSGVIKKDPNPQVGEILLLNNGILGTPS
ncbi:Cerevisin [Dactylellina cionopaga]|nr:Cerevisin [Dactylellina cionopaga]